MGTPAVTPDPYASIAVPMRAQADPYAAIAKPLPPDLASNPNNEGVYKMNGPNGSVGVPYSKVAAAQGQGFAFGNSNDQQRYVQDHNADPKDSRGFIQKQKEDFDQTTAPAQDDSLGRFATKRVIKGVFTPFVHPVDTAVGTAKLVNQGINSMEMSGSLGMDPGINARVANGPATAIAEQTANDYRQGGVVRAGTGIASDVAGGLIGGKVIGTLGDAALAARNGVAPKPVPGQNYNTAHAAAFEGLAAKANGMGSNFIPQSLTPDALSPIRQSAADMLSNGTPVEQAIARKVTAAGVKPLDRLAAVHSVIQRSLSDLEAQHTPVLQQVASTPVDMTPIQRGLQAQIVPGMSAADVAGINDLIQRSGQITNLGELNKFRGLMNDEASPSYRQSPTQAGRASAPQQVATDTANAVRNHYYDQMQQATVSPQNPTGIDFQPLKAKQSSLLTTREAIERMQSPLSKAQGDFNAPMTKRAVAGELGEAVVNVVKNPKKLVQQQILRESPAASTSYLIRKALTGLPDATPPSVQSPSIINPQTPGLIPAKSAPQVIQGTPVNPSPQAPPTLQLPPWLQNLLPQAASDGGVPAYQQPTPPPPVNPSTAVTRITPTQFASSPEVAPTLTRPVTPSGQVLTPLQRFLQAGDLDKSIVSPSTDDLKRAITNIRRRKGK